MKPFLCDWMESNHRRTGCKPIALSLSYNRILSGETVMIRLLIRGRDLFYQIKPPQIERHENFEISTTDLEGRSSASELMTQIVEDVEFEST